MEKQKELKLGSLALPIFFDMALKTLSVTLNVFMVAHVNVLLVGAMSAGIKYLRYLSQFLAFYLSAVQS